MIWRADTDKAHRCPGRSLPDGHPRRCPNGYVSCEETGWYFRRLHVYQCRDCGMRVTVFPGWPHYPGTDSWKWRLWWFWWHDLIVRPLSNARYMYEAYGLREGLRREWQIFRILHGRRKGST